MNDAAHCHLQVPAAVRVCTVVMEYLCLISYLYVRELAECVGQEIFKRSEAVMWWRDGRRWSSEWGKVVRRQKSRAREGGGGVGGVQIGVTSDHHGNVAITQHFQGHGKVAFNETVHLIEALPLLFLTYSGSGEFYLYGVSSLRQRRLW